MTPWSLALVLACLAALPAAAHEFWLDARDWRPPAGGDALLDIRVGHDMAGPAYPFRTHRSARLEAELAGLPLPLDPPHGAEPAVALPDLAPGLLVVAHETRPSRLRYDDAAAFRAFVAEKSLDGTLEAHKARGLPPDGVTETFTRHVKALVGVGHARGADRPFGLEHEIVALANPYADDLAGGLPVRVLLHGAPRPDAQVTLFERAPDGTVAATTHRTDAEGRALLPVRPGRAYLADSVTMVPQDPAADRAMWRSLWAALTFAVPER